MKRIVITRLVGHTYYARLVRPMVPHPMLACRLICQCHSTASCRSQSLPRLWDPSGTCWHHIMRSGIADQQNSSRWASVAGLGSLGMDIVALKSMYPLLSLLCTKMSSCGCAER